MESESIVYGCIRDWPGDSMERRMRRAANRRVLDSLPGGEAWPFLGREMFSRCEQSGAGLYQTQIIHFGASYQAIEYEWSLWVEQFEALLADAGFRRNLIASAPHADAMIKSISAALRQ